MIDHQTEIAPQEIVESILRQLHRATEDDEDYRTVFADVTRQLVDRLEGCEASWRTPARYPRTAELMRTVVDPAVAGHSENALERRSTYAGLFRKVSESVLCGVHHAQMKADIERGLHA